MPHILLVDHYEDFCQILTCSLRNEGYTTSTALDENNGIKQFYKQVPDLILLDFMLPNVHNMKFCKQIRSFSKVPIMILSVEDQNINDSWTIEAGVDGYITKPFKIPELLMRLKALLDNSSANFYRPKDSKNKMAGLTNKKYSNSNYCKAAVTLMS